jgi:transcriptional regulator with XRE-family HTH domain
MKQSQLIVKQLKKVMKANGISYKDLALRLKISESSVKRIFSKGTFTLERLDEICEIMGIEIYDLTKSIKANQGEEQVMLSNLQEQILADDEKLFAYFYLLITGSLPKEIVKLFQFTEEESNKLLLKLDKVKLIEYHSAKKIKLNFPQNLQWIKGGPLNKVYEARIKDEFLKSSFNQTNEYINFFSGYFTEQDIKTLNRKIKKLFDEIEENSEFISEKSSVKKIWLLFAYRPWEFSYVTKWIRR